MENEVQAREAVRNVKANGVNALVVFLGNFGPETPETLIADWFHGPIMYVASAEGDGDLHDGRGDAYCGMLNCSYNLGLRGKTAYIPEYPVGTASELAEKISEFVPIARAMLGLKGLKVITFGPRPDDFLPAVLPSRPSTTWTWRWRRTPSWICWRLTTSTPAMSASSLRSRRWRPNWVVIIPMAASCPGWLSTS